MEMAFFDLGIKSDPEKCDLRKKSDPRKKSDLWALFASTALNRGKWENRSEGQKVEAGKI